MKRTLNVSLTLAPCFSLWRLLVQIRSFLPIQPDSTFVFCAPLNAPTKAKQVLGMLHGVIGTWWVYLKQNQIILTKPVKAVKCKAKRQQLSIIKRRQSHHQQRGRRSDIDDVAAIRIRKKWNCLAHSSQIRAQRRNGWLWKGLSTAVLPSRNDARKLETRQRLTMRRRLAECRRQSTVWHFYSNNLSIPLLSFVFLS